jgi:hypothetical protein
MITLPVQAGNLSPKKTQRFKPCPIDSLILPLEARDQPEQCQKTKIFSRLLPLSFSHARMDDVDTHFREVEWDSTLHRSIDF